MHLVHKEANQGNAAAGFSLAICLAGGVADSGVTKSLAFIRHADSNLLRVDLDFERDELSRVVLVTVFDRVG